MIRQVAIALSLLLLFPSAAQTDPSLAVLPFSASGIDTRLSTIVADAVRNEISDLGGFAVLRRDVMQEILRTHALLDTFCYERTCAVEMGKVLSVDKVLAGTITLRGGEVYLECSIIDVATGRERASADRVISHSPEITPYREAGQTLARSLLGYPVIKRGWRKWITPVAIAVAGVAYLVHQQMEVETGDAEIIARFPGR